MILDTRLANTPRWCIGHSGDMDMRVPDEVRECVVYLGLPVIAPDGREMMRPKGTAFFVAVPSQEIEGTTYVYLVTAKHVARAVQDREFFVRVNDKDGRAVLIRSGGARWWFHATDESADVAVLAWAPPEFVEHKRIPTGMFLTDETVRSRSIGTGDEVFITGLFVHLAGSQRNVPIVRMGNIAMMPDEPVPTEMGMIDAYLIEARSIGGLSGSPAFVRETVPMGIGAFYLLGLMHGHWDIPPETRDDEMRTDVEDALGKVNMGIAVVVPAKKILEVLNQPRLVEKRKQEDEELRKRRMPTLDEAMEKQTANEKGLTKEESEEAL